MSEKKLTKYKQINNKLDEIIALDQPKLRTVLLHQDLTIKLSSSFAISSFTTYISYQQLLDIKFNITLFAIYECMLIGFAFYINNYPGKVILRNVYLIFASFSSIYYLVDLGHLWNLSENSYYDFLYIFDFLIMLIAIVFSLLSNISNNSQHGFVVVYTDEILFKFHRHMIMSNLIKFDNQEIRAALSRLNNIKNKLSKKTDQYIRNNSILHFLLALGSILISPFQNTFQSATWFNLAMTSLSIILVLASAIMISAVIKNIPHTRTEVFIRQRWFILIQYNIERLKLTNFLFENELNTNT